jgi:hypothetical protein
MGCCQSMAVVSWWRMSFFKPPGQCPGCGEWISRHVRACDCCGACEETGWQAGGGGYDGLDLPEDPDDFDYDAFIEEEFGKKQPRENGKTLLGKKKLWWWVALVLLGLWIYAMLSGAF